MSQHAPALVWHGRSAAHGRSMAAAASYLTAERAARRPNTPAPACRARGAPPRAAARPRFSFRPKRQNTAGAQLSTPVDLLVKKKQRARRGTTHDIDIVISLFNSHDTP